MNRPDCDCDWTKENKMLLNKKKSNAMLFNFTNKFQFATRIKMEDDVIEIINETKLLGVMVNDRLNWNSNTAFLVKRANARMRLLHKLVEFEVPQEDLINIYVLYIRSILEQSCQVWHSSLSLENFQDLERVQKNALRIILKDDYLSYSNALNATGLFSLNDVDLTMETRFREKFKVTAARTERLKNSAVPYSQEVKPTD